MKQIVLDTETTGLDPTQGHRIIEIGCVEIEDRKLTGRNFQVYLNPGREIDEAAIEVHGLTPEFLSDKPKFSEIYHEFCSFIEDSEVIIHNAPFDVAFIDSEFGKLRLQKNKLSDYCTILDTLVLARNKHPGQRNSLDALFKLYDIIRTRWFEQISYFVKSIQYWRPENLDQIQGEVVIWLIRTV